MLFLSLRMCVCTYTKYNNKTNNKKKKPRRTKTLRDLFLRIIVIFKNLETKIGVYQMAPQHQSLTPSSTWNPYKGGMKKATPQNCPSTST